MVKEKIQKGQRHSERAEQVRGLTVPDAYTQDKAAVGRQESVVLVSQ